MPGFNCNLVYLIFSTKKIDTIHNYYLLAQYLHKHRSVLFIIGIISNLTRKIIKCVFFENNVYNS